MSGNRFSFGNMDALPEIVVQNDWKKDNYQKSIISPLPQKSCFQRYFCWCWKPKIYS